MLPSFEGPEAAAVPDQVIGPGLVDDRGVAAVDGLVDEAPDDGDVGCALLDIAS
jgi:hypothetical protein